jgi:hypothetical protein
MRRRLLSQEQVDLLRTSWETKTRKEWCREFGVSRTALNKYLIELNIQFKYRKKVVSEEARQKIRIGRKEWLKNNPEKHPWRNKDKFKSKPCEKAAEFLTNLGIKFAAEYKPEIDGRFFSIDIALPDKMIALEINGNQHYERDGKLKPYYQERHNLLESAGWTVFEIHYSACFNMEKWSNFAELLRGAETVKEFDYFSYIPRKTGKQIVEEKRKEKAKKLSERPDHYDFQINSKMLNKETLHYLNWEIPAVEIGKLYGVSGNAIKRWNVKFGLSKPSVGEWFEIKHNKQFDYQI